MKLTEIRDRIAVYGLICPAPTSRAEVTSKSPQIPTDALGTHAEQSHEMQHVRCVEHAV